MFVFSRPQYGWRALVHARLFWHSCKSGWHAIGLLAAMLLAVLSSSPVQAQVSVGSSAHYAALKVVEPVQACADLMNLDLSQIGGVGSKITAAEKTSGKNGAVCAVTGVLAPTIQFSVQLPLQRWTQRYLQIGCSGLCGNISNNVGAADGCVPLNAGGFVIGATDMGHQGQDAAFGDDPRKRADFAYRAQHLTAVVARQLMRAFYGKPQTYAYFSGCSDGGREALIEAQRYPGDFDGVIAGAAALNFQAQNAMFHAWQAHANTGPDGKPILLARRLPILHNAVLAACDKLDGLVDGLVSDPQACHFDPATLQCPAASKDTSACLTAAEVAVVRKFYDGPRDPASGKRLTAGGPQFGSELAWAGVYVPHSASQSIFSEMVSLQVLLHMAFETNPPAGFGLANMNFDQVTFDKLRTRHRLFDATNPDLSAFAAHGGKLILWHGWADPHISPINTIAYYTAVQAQMGKQAENFTRLYLFPGMYHCSNGEGPYQVDLLTPMMNWVEGHVAPDAVLANQPEHAATSDFGAPMQQRKGSVPGKDGSAPSAPPGAIGDMGRMGGGAPMGGPDGPPPDGDRPMGPPGEMGQNGPMKGERPMGEGAPVAAAAAPVKILRSRPVYPWPYSTIYDGKGDPTKAASFVRGPVLLFEMPDWAGADFFQPFEVLRN
jgi:hypothetical protein